MDAITPKNGTVSGLSPPSCRELASALMTLLDALIAHRKSKRPPSKLECFSGGQLLATPETVCRARGIVKDPVDFALRHCMSEVAHLVAKHFTLEEIVAAVDHELEVDARRYGPLDAAFDGARCKDGAVYLK
jgi:hypothetical protein